MSPCLHPDLLAEIDAHCAEHNLSRSGFGEAAVGDPRFVFDVGAGRELRRRTIERVRDFIATGTTWAEVKENREAAE